MSVCPQEMTHFCGADSIESYATTLIDFGTFIGSKTDKILNLEDIVTGKAIEQITKMVNYPLDKNAKISCLVIISVGLV